MKMIVVCLIVISLLVVSSVAAGKGHSFEETTVRTFNQENLHKETGIGLGKDKMKSDVFVMFYASWCPHCQALMPTWVNLRDQTANNMIVALHCPDNMEICDTF